MNIKILKLFIHEAIWRVKHYKSGNEIDVEAPDDASELYAKRKAEDLFSLVGPRPRPYELTAHILVPAQKIMPIVFRLPAGRSDFLKNELNAKAKGYDVYKGIVYHPTHWEIGTPDDRTTRWCAATSRPGIVIDVKGYDQGQSMNNPDKFPYGDGLVPKSEAADALISNANKNSENYRYPENIDVDDAEEAWNYIRGDFGWLNFDDAVREIIN